MQKIIKFLSIGVVLATTTSLYSSNGKQVFETYCWGCHHQTAVAFGPHFKEISSKRNANEIRAMISNPASVSKAFGYKRNAMPSFQLSEENLTAITKYILSYKVVDINKTEESNQTIIKENK